MHKEHFETPAKVIHTSRLAKPNYELIAQTKILDELYQSFDSQKKVEKRSQSQQEKIYRQK